MCGRGCLLKLFLLILGRWLATDTRWCHYNGVWVLLYLRLVASGSEITKCLFAIVCCSLRWANHCLYAIDHRVVPLNPCCCGCEEMLMLLDLAGQITAKLSNACASEDALEVGLLLYTHIWDSDWVHIWVTGSVGRLWASWCSCCVHLVSRVFDSTSTAIAAAKGASEA